LKTLDCDHINDQQFFTFTKIILWPNWHLYSTKPG
jgi:hypothetical protein